MKKERAPNDATTNVGERSSRDCLTLERCSSCLWLQLAHLISQPLSSTQHRMRVKMVSQHSIMSSASTLHTLQPSSEPQASS